MALWSLKGRTILVVDDFPEMRSMLRSMLAMYGGDAIQQARHGEEAIERMQAQSFEIVLCDYNLGEGKDGQQVLEEAKHRDLLPYDSTFVMVTAENTSEMVMGALEYQPDAYLSKPVTRTVLQARLKKLLDKKAQMAPVAKALARQDYNQVIALCDRFIEQGTKFRYELLKLKTDMLLNIGEFDQAEALFTRVLEDRELPWARMGLGRVRFHRQDYDGAIATFDAVIEQQRNFVAAYDWRARALERKGDAAAAQESLQLAVNVSPKSLQRQRALADIADFNQDYATTEKARRQALRVGRGSVLRQPTDFSGLARALGKQGSAKEGLKVLDQLRHECREDPRTGLVAAVAESAVQQALGNASQAAAVLDSALELAAGQPELLTGAAGNELVQTCLEQGRTGPAHEVARSLVMNNHDDEDVLKRLSMIYREAGLAEAGNDLIRSTREEVVELNNEGVALINAGRIEESIDFFSNAVKVMPSNAVFNLNAAHSLILFMKRSGPSREHLTRALGYIRAAEGDELHRDWRHNLMRACRSMAGAMHNG
ncbi:MAG TPA: response regulator [Thiohalobacter sp.]|nr:response regulator [Thiohalobacter sp.]